MKLLSQLLVPVSWLYGLGIRLRNFCYDRGIFRIEQAGAPVISVGNLTAGGTGKTPFVEYLLRFCSRERLRVAVVSRGYKRKSKGMIVVGDEKGVHCDAETGGDEPVQIASKFPGTVVLVDEVRSRAAKFAVNTYNVDGIILDDGFQHRSLARDLDIVMIDGKKECAGARLLPAGMWREPASSLRRANVAVVSEGKFADEAHKLINRMKSLQFAKVRFAPTGVRRVGSSAPVQSRELQGKRCVGFCGIANPDVFLESLKNFGLNVVEVVPFPDHHHYRTTDWETIRERFDGKAEFLITTEKDAVRLKSSPNADGMAEVDLFYLEIDACVVEGEAALHSLIRSELRRSA